MSRLSSPEVQLSKWTPAEVLYKPNSQLHYFRHNLVLKIAHRNVQANTARGALWGEASRGFSPAARRLGKALPKEIIQCAGRLLPPKPRALQRVKWERYCTTEQITRVEIRTQNLRRSVRAHCVRWAMGLKDSALSGWSDGWSGVHAARASVH